MYVRRLRDGIADRYGVPPSALASLDPSTVAKMAARVQEERVIRVRIEHAASPSRRRTVRSTTVADSGDFAGHGGGLMWSGALSPPEGWEAISWRPVQGFFPFE